MDEQKQQLRIIWSAMLTALALYGVVCLLVVGPAETQNPDTERLRHAFSAVGLVLGVLSFWWHRHFLPAESHRPEGEAGIDFARLQGHGVVVWALSEAVGLCGLALAVVVHDVREFVPFGVAAAALLVRLRPSNLPWSRLSRPAP
jgi:F0F1-type ATP synthase membrane subunit c/vacuolar-type H+-ATPase subunit K